MGRLIALKDWSTTPLGPIAGWPQSLRTAVSICTASRYPMAIWWGPDATQLYNDGYIAALGAKHPEALGQRASDCWAEIWNVVGPLYDQVMQGGESTWSDDLLLLMERHGYVEETYFTFSYSPIHGESGGVGGMLITCAETTARVIGERRLRTLRDLSSRTADARSVREACDLALATLAENPADLPAVALDLVEAGGSVPVRFGVAGRPERLPPAHQTSSLAVSERAAVVPGADPNRDVLVLPMAGAGYLVAAASPRRPLDDDYRGFFELVTRQLAGAIANARAYEEAHRQAEALAELDRAKTAFFSNVSHEFRTPLTLLLGPLEDALADSAEPLSERHRERLSLAHRNSLRLLRLVNTLLEFTRLESGRVDAAFEPTDLAALTADLASGFRSAAERAGLQLIVDCPALPEPIYVDREMWEKIVLNLLSNALKFTLTGEIRVALRAADGAVRLEVRDTGVGIPAEEMPRIFDRFHRVRESQARSQEGTGIGLALVRELVTLHGGRVEVTSTPGQGAAFTITIPLGARHLPAEQVRSDRRPVSGAGAALPYVEEAARWLPPEVRRVTPPRRGGVRIVLADDNADMRDYVLRLLGEGWRVDAVADGERALETVMREPPDLLIADVMMPRLDGFALLQAVRSTERTRSVPVILLSARAGEEARLDGLRAGADDYLVKPFSARELLARVESILALARVRREAEASVRASEERYRAYIELTSDAIWRIELEEPVPVSLPPDAQIERFYARAALAECNEAMAQMYGFGSAAELAGVRLGDLLPRDDPHNIDYLRRFIASGYRLAEAESNEVGRDGQPRYFVNNLFGVVENGQLVRAWGSQRDVTERHRTLERLQQAQRMESVGKLAGGIAHEVNNMMSVVLGCADFVLRRPDLHPAVRVDVEQAREAAERSAAITAQLLAFSRRQMLRPVPLDLNQVVRELEPVLRRTLGETVSLELRLAPLGAIRADRGQLQQVLLNLALNARDAMPRGGRVTIETAAVELGRTDAAEHPEIRLRQGPYALLRMSDSGHGMDHETVRHVFEPFFTTKGIGKGTGLGLSTVYGIVKQSDGYIWVDSEPGHGAVFRVYLPLVDVAVAADAPVSAPPGGSGSGTVLVVEDEAMVRAMVVRALREEGYGVLQAESGAEALAMLEQTGADVRLVLTDLAMAEIGGRELGQRLADRRPRLPILYMSGYPLDEVVRRGLLEDSQPFLQKPFTPASLLEAVRALLDASALGPAPAAALAARE